MRVRLTRKLAECVDGVDLTGCRVGDVLDLTPREARLLVAEDWATSEERRKASGEPPSIERRAKESLAMDIAPVAISRAS
jgi:hypothetical protein